MERVYIVGFFEKGWEVCESGHNDGEGKREEAARVGAGNELH